MILSTFLTFIAVLPTQAKANHPTFSQLELQYWGYTQYKNFDFLKISSLASWPYKENSLPFPLEHELAAHNFGSNMHQYQNFTQPAYYHAGLDIRTTTEQAIRAPVSGKIEAGFYAYTDHYDGHSEKFFLPLEEALNGNAVPPWGEYYFEVAIIDKHGNRFEFHHINSKTLPENIKHKILNHDFVVQNEAIGFVSEVKSKVLGQDYTHMHYNIVTANGMYINPMYVSHKVEDTSSPHIANIFAVTKKSGCGSQTPFLIPFSDDIPQTTDGYIVIETHDFISESLIPNPPTIIQAQFDKNNYREWNFKASLNSDNGLRPKLNDVYLKEYCDYYGESKTSPILKTASSNFKFFIKLPVPTNYTGEAQITIADHYGNSTKRKIVIKKDSI